MPDPGAPAARPPRSRLKDLLLSLTLTAGSIVFTLFVLEIVLRFMPVSTGLASMPVDAAHPVLHYAPNRQTINSFGWDMHNVVVSRVNNAGFVNAQDYVADDPRPLVAVIGDSFIEAQMVPYPNTVQGRLAKQLDGKARVYSFAGSGAPLSQYLIWSQFAVKAYGARALVISVVGNDFDESLLAYRLGPGFWQYVPAAGGALRLRLIEHHPGWLIKLVRHSALGRYLVINLQVSRLIFQMRSVGEWIFGQPAHASPQMVGATDQSTDPKRVRDSLAVIDAFFRDLPEMTGLPPQRIMFIVDGFRYPEAQQQGKGKYFDLMRRAFIAKGRQQGYETVDLDDLFIPRHAKTGEEFEFDDDGHWNSTGHGVAAEAVMSSHLLANLLH